MKNRIFSLLLAAALVAALAVPVSAQTYKGETEWLVAFTASEEMSQNFSSQQWYDVFSDLQPGDSAVFTINIENQHPETTDWYMENTVIQSLEDNFTNTNTTGGGYTYYLAYFDQEPVLDDNGLPTSEPKYLLFDSENLGGEDVIKLADKTLQGLDKATTYLSADAIEDMFYLDTLVSGQKGYVVLRVNLDGETQGNDYQDTLAQLRLRFGVTLGTSTATASPSPSTSPAPSTSKTTTATRVVKTGDETDMLPYYIAMTVSGVLLLVLGIFSLRKRKADRKGGA